MATYILRRLILAVIVIFIITIIAFLIMQIIPGDPVRAMLGVDASPKLVDSLRKELWLDRPLLVQYIHWLGNAIKGDFGISVQYQTDVGHLWAARLPITINLSILAIIISTIFGIIAGTISAVTRGSFLDQVISVLANAGVAIPVFWLGILGIYFFGLYLNWLPIQGYTSPFSDFWLSMKKLLMPVVCLSVPGLAMMTRQTRSSMLEVIRQDYIRTAWSKGLTQRVIIFRHAFKNALNPIATLVGVMLPIMVGGSVLVETVFNIPGMGRLLVGAVLNKDFIVVQAGILLIAIVVSMVNLIVDISYGWFDPRIRYE
jgi:peptide/nickel transport system permease protein